MSVALAPEPFATAARDLNVGFISRMQHGRPLCASKRLRRLMASRPSPTAAANGSPARRARADSHAFRRRAVPSLTGIGTVLADDPRLDVRAVETTLQPLRVIVDSPAHCATGPRVLAAPGTACLVHAGANGAGRACRRRGRSPCPTADGRVDLPALLGWLAERGVNELHVEAGATLNGALLAAGFGGRILLYQAPVLLGRGMPIASLPPLPDLTQATAGAASKRPPSATTFGCACAPVTLGIP